MSGLRAIVTRYVETRLVLEQSEKKQLFNPRSVLDYALLMLK